jgi:hypothetical protein
VNRDFSTDTSCFRQQSDTILAQGEQREMTYALKNLLRIVWIPILLLLTYPVHANASVNNFIVFARACGVTPVIASARVFSDNDKKQWKEYANPKEVPGNAQWSETAYVWAKPNSPVVMDVEGLGEDFADSAYYCFDTSGRLSSIEHEFRTAWDWGFTEQRQFDSAGKETTKSHFFSTKDRKEIPRPQGANDVREAMTVKVYKRLSDVPFFSLLTGSTPSKW